MCRIYGIFGGGAIDEQSLVTATRLQLHGGPDQQDCRRGAGWALGANRLAIQGLEGGAQPYHAHGVHAVFNGEIYNHRDLRVLLKSLGHDIRGMCDGSIIPHLYLEFDDRLFEMLDGMFAVAIVDARPSRERLLVACDHLAIKSVYLAYSDKTKRLHFASELDALHALVPDPPRVNDLELEALFAFRAPLGDRTFFEGVETLTPGEVREFTREGSRRRWRFQPRLAVGTAQSETGETDAGHLGVLLESETKRLLEADVSVCLVTSGGLDSSLLTALACASGRPIECFNIAYKGQWPSDERSFAHEVARHCGAGLHQVELDPAELPDLLPKMVRRLGQPNSAPQSASTYALFEAVSQGGFKVAITGEGADELFAGYERFAFPRTEAGWIDRYLDAMAPIPLQVAASIFHADFLKRLQGSEIRAAFRDRLASAATQGLEGLLRLELEERFPNYILRRVDHLSMAHAVEVRVPFCQYSVRRFAQAVPEAQKIMGRQRKVVLGGAAEGRLPRSVLERPKQPFTLPIAAMLRPGERIFDFATDIIGSKAFRERGIFDPEAALGLLQAQARGPQGVAAQALWMILISELWLRQQALPIPALALH